MLVWRLFPASFRSFVTLVEVTPSLALHEIPPRAGKCQMGQTGKFWGEEGRLTCVRGGRASQSHPPSPEAACTKHTQPLSIRTGVRRPADQNVGAVGDPFVKHCPVSPFLSLRSRFSPPLCFTLARLRLLLSGRFPGCNHSLLTAGCWTVPAEQK